MKSDRQWVGFNPVSKWFHLLTLLATTAILMTMIQLALVRRLTCRAAFLAVLCTGGTSQGALYFTDWDLQIIPPVRVELDGPVVHPNPLAIQTTARVVFDILEDIYRIESIQFAEPPAYSNSFMDLNGDQWSVNIRLPSHYELRLGQEFPFNQAQVALLGSHRAELEIAGPNTFAVGSIALGHQSALTQFVRPQPAGDGRLSTTHLLMIMRWHVTPLPPQLPPAAARRLDDLDFFLWADSMLELQFTPQNSDRILRPIPEPAALALLAVSLFCLVTRRRA
ncbi:MAG TPA: PEP-CTERM sorting domain-containing protein [Verrucomicrobiales bacterium]|nr:PEP-CTERM sorting domain-containing protein [Verrucomicrobiales bacterium]